jgi:hypothetical protein
LERFRKDCSKHLIIVASTYFLFAFSDDANMPAGLANQYRLRAAQQHMQQLGGMPNQGSLQNRSHMILLADSALTGPPMAGNPPAGYGTPQMQNMQNIPQNLQQVSCVSLSQTG